VESQWGPMVRCDSAGKVREVFGTELQVGEFRLKPGTTESEVLRLLGEPTASYGQKSGESFPCKYLVYESAGLVVQLVPGDAEPVVRSCKSSLDVSELYNGSKV